MANPVTAVAATRRDDQQALPARLGLTTGATVAGVQTVRTLTVCTTVRMPTGKRPPVRSTLIQYFVDPRGVATAKATRGRGGS